MQWHRHPCAPRRCDLPHERHPSRALPLCDQFQDKLASSFKPSPDKKDSSGQDGERNEDDTFMDLYFSGKSRDFSTRLRTISRNKVAVEALRMMSQCAHAPCCPRLPLRDPPDASLIAAVPRARVVAKRRRHLRRWSRLQPSESVDGPAHTPQGAAPRRDRAHVSARAVGSSPRCDSEARRTQMPRLPLSVVRVVVAGIVLSRETWRDYTDAWTTLLQTRKMMLAKWCACLPSISIFFSSPATTPEQARPSGSSHAPPAVSQLFDASSPT